jgi:hypothetical protein
MQEAVEVIPTEIGVDSQHFDTKNGMFDGGEVQKCCPDVVYIVEVG